MNVVDAVLLIFLGLCVLLGWRRGLIGSVLEIVGVVVALLCAASYMERGGYWIRHIVPLPYKWAVFGSFLTILIVLSTSFGWIASYAHRLIRLSPVRMLDAVTGAVFSLFKGLFIASVGLLLSTFIPLPNPTQHAIEQSLLASPIARFSPFVLNRLAGSLPHSGAFSVRLRETLRDDPQAQERMHRLLQSTGAAQESVQHSK